MVRLSRKGWNNVVLFSALTMILLFNITGNKLSSNSKLATILPLNSEIIFLSLDQHKWQKSPEGWYILDQQIGEVNKGKKNNQSMVLSRAINLWQTQQLPIWDEAVGGVGDVLRIKIQVDKLSSPIELSLFYSDDKILLSNWQGQLLLVEPAVFKELFPLMAPVI